MNILFQCFSKEAMRNNLSHIIPLNPLKIIQVFKQNNRQHKNFGIIKDTNI